MENHMMELGSFKRVPIATGYPGPKPPRLLLATMLVLSSEDCFPERQAQSLPNSTSHTAPRIFSILAQPRECSGFFWIAVRTQVLGYGSAHVFGVPCGGICNALSTPVLDYSTPQLFLTKALLFLAFNNYYQPTILNNSPSTATQAAMSGRYLSIPHTVTTTPSITLTPSIIIFRTTIPLPRIGLHS